MHTYNLNILLIAKKINIILLFSLFYTKITHMTYPKKRNLILAGIIFLSGILLGGKILLPKIIPIHPEDNMIYVATYITDGDTFKINNNTRIRLLGIDAPEKNECYYQESRQALIDLIEHKEIKLEKDITDKDRYDRWLRYAILIKKNEDNMLVNDYMVRQGYAITTSIAPDNRYRDLLSTAQEKAKKNNLGLWAACDYETENPLREQDSGPTNPDCIIKGNISEKGFGRTYLIPGCDNYNTVKIDTRKGEAYFCTEEEAIQAGFRKATNCP